MAEQSVKTPEQVKAAQARRLARKELREYAQSLKAGDKVQKLIYAVIGSGEGRGRKEGSGISGQLAAILREKQAISELDVFKQFHIGRPEMSTQIRRLVNAKTPANRLWVSFDVESETYKLQGVGVNPPKGWEGPVPPKESEL